MISGSTIEEVVFHLHVMRAEQYVGKPDQRGTCAAVRISLSVRICGSEPSSVSHENDSGTNHSQDQPTIAETLRRSSLPTDSTDRAVCMPQLYLRSYNELCLISIHFSFPIPCLNSKYCVKWGRKKVFVFEWMVVLCLLRLNLCLFLTKRQTKGCCGDCYDGNRGAEMARPHHSPRF